MSTSTPPDNDIVLKITCGGAPLVFEGVIGGHNVFYRGRHGRWRIEIDDVEVASGEATSDQDTAEALKRIGEHCFRILWDGVMARESAAYDQMENR